MRSLRLSALLVSALAGNAFSETHDLVVYGGTSAGIAAAVQVKRMGGTVVILEPGRRIGGLTTGGLGQTDIGNKHVIGGIARQFYQDIRSHYRDPAAWTWQKMPEGNFRGSGQTITTDEEETQWTFEPSAALRVFEKWISGHGITVVYGQRLDRTGEGRAAARGDGYWLAQPGSVSRGVRKDGAKILSITMESGETYHGRMFMDATFEGDLMAAAGVSFTIGREGEPVHGENLNGVQVSRSTGHDFVDGVDPYVIPGDPASGLLMWIDPDGPGAEGASDHRIQAYCFRMCLTDHPENRIPFQKPAGYDEAWYELLFRNYEAGHTGMPWINSSMPNRKTDTNNRTGFSTDFIGENYDWPEGSYERRAELREHHLKYQQGLMWSLANHPRIPQKVREEVSRWGMTKDEFPEGGGWQDQIYVREGRRMISAVVMTQHHCQRRTVAENSVGMGAYNMDSHNTQRYVNEAGQVKNEGNIEVGVPPYPIDYASIVPKQEECENLLVPIALSSSHIAFGSIRMEPVFMILGQSGATAAMHALEEKKPLQAIDPDKLRERLLADGQILQFDPPARPAGAASFIPLKDLAGVVADDAGAERTGAWVETILAAGVGSGYSHDGGDSSKPASATFTLVAAEAGKHAVQIASWPNENRSSRTLVTVRSRAVEKEQRIDQRRKPPVDGLWFPLEVLELAAGQEVKVTVSNAGADGHVILDAARLLKSP
jgi:hypothetical protein